MYIYIDIYPAQFHNKHTYLKKEMKRIAYKFNIVVLLSHKSKRSGCYH